MDTERPRGAVQFPGRGSRIRMLSAARRLVAGVVLGVVTGTAVGWVEPWQFTILAGWVSAGLWFVGSVWFAVGPLDAEQTAAFATRADDSRFGADLWLLGASTASLVGVGLDLVRAREVTGFESGLLTAAAVVAVAVSWAVVHTTYALRYAHLYYSTPPGGIDFKNDRDPPDYLDFAYVAATVGMTFQV
ncbi:MAG TPA: DUF1345 domain-containing protein, partial [Acidimicrobiia bacterium]|nr:DUF1345 domain-containing protein [Acidimicrobiia bacterium]